MQKTFMFIEYDDLWYGGMQYYAVYNDESFYDAIQTLNFATDSIVDCYVIENNIPEKLSTYFCNTKTFKVD